MALVKSAGWVRLVVPTSSSRARAAHHIRDAESAADLHQLAARHHHLAAVGQAVEQQQDRCCIVVDHSGRFGAGQFADQCLYPRIAVAATATDDVELQIDRRGHRAGDCLHRGLGQQCATQVGMQYGAGQVEHRLQVQPCIGCQCGLDRCHQRRAVDRSLQLRGRQLTGADALTQHLQVRTQQLGDAASTVAFDQWRQCRQAQHPVQRGQGGGRCRGGGMAVIASIAVGLPQQRILAGTRIVFLGQQQIQRQRAEVIGHRLQ